MKSPILALVLELLGILAFVTGCFGFTYVRIDVQNTLDETVLVKVDTKPIVITDTTSYKWISALETSKSVYYVEGGTLYFYARTYRMTEPDVVIEEFSRVVKHSFKLFNSNDEPDFLWVIDGTNGL